DYIEMEEKMLSMLYQHFLGKDLTEEERALVDQVDHDLLKYDLFYLLNVGEEADLPTLLSYYEFGKASFQEIEERYLRRYEALSNRVKL
ncbi:MAG: hypothetical protein KBS83_04310, partial [Lachnospiraceae bacterium]|nr:hypothetical protein [Candidatus Equihabitans merdae]